MRRTLLHQRTNKGFSLVELLISIAIITLLSTVVVARFTTFDSTVLLKSLAYEIAASIREAQTYSLSVLGVASGSGFKTPYGVSFIPGTKEYSIFKYAGSNSIPRNDVDATEVQKYTITRSMVVSDVCAITASDEYCSADGITGIDVSFRRPEFRSLYHGENLPGGVSDGDIEAIKIKLTATRGISEVWVAEVGLTGQIAVYLE